MSVTATADSLWCMQIKAILSRDLPPHGLWQWVCGGLNVMDALLVLCWFALTLTWTWGKSAGRIPRINGRMHQDQSLGLVPGKRPKAAIICNQDCCYMVSSAVAYICCLPYMDFATLQKLGVCTVMGLSPIYLC